MPFLDVLEATSEILEYEEDYNQKHIPIIALTANALKGDRERFLAAGLDEYTTKPLVREEIIALLHQFLSEYVVESTEVLEMQKEEIELSQEIDLTQLDEITEAEEDIKIETYIDEPTEVIKEPITEEVLIQNNIPTQVEKKHYKADILLAKKSSFELKLFKKLLESLGYSYDVASSQDEIFSSIKEASYQVIFFDKACEGLDIAKLSQAVDDSTANSSLTTSLILITNEEDNKEDKLYAQEIIKNVVNKNLLKAVFEKFIKDDT